VKFAEFGSKIDWIKYGLDKPKTTVAVTLTSEELKKPTEHVILLGNDAPDGGVYARVDGQERVAIIDIDTAKALRRTHMDFADRNLLRFDAERVMLIERKKKGADFEIARQDDAYVLIKPGPRDADTLTVFDLLRRASQLEAVRIVSLAEKDLKPFGLDAPDAVITFHIESFDGSTKKHVIKLGSQTAKDSDERFAMIDERPMVVVLSRELSRLVSAPILFYADRNLASFANVDWLELTRGERKDVFTRTDKGWRLKQPIDAGADAVVIDDMIRSLQRLRADEIVAHADKGTDLKKYGLDQPLLQWRLKGGDTEHLHLIVGAAENEQPGARRFAKLANKAAIFLLSNKISAKLQAECADRTAWPAFKSADVGKLTITQRDKSFVLTFADKKWQLAGDAKAKVNEPEVLDTLVTLQSLTAARWVAHAKADLKKYGLADPAWKLEIELAKEKRVLLLGNAEDKSKRLYASVQGAGAVFVIDEIDSTILARPRSAYLVEEKKVEPKKDPGKKQVLLLWHSPDGHPKDTHEYELGQKILKATLEKHAAVDAILVHADDPWKDGPELLAKADGVVLFISEGAKWLSADEKRLAAFRAAAKRGTGLAVLHWGMGTKDAKNIDAFVELFGGCHGGPDRKYKVVQTQATIADKSHPIMQGIADFKVRDEFYYTLKFAKSRMPLLNVAIDGEAHPVAWALQREGGGRSFGFSGLHFHENWQTPEYRRLVAQGVLWTLNLPIPKDGLEVK
jgi:type 1 glutamine amidotransferase